MEGVGGKGVLWDRETGAPHFPSTISLLCPVACSWHSGSCRQEHKSNRECGMTVDKTLGSKTQGKQVDESGQVNCTPKQMTFTERWGSHILLTCWGLGHSRAPIWMLFVNEQMKTEQNGCPGENRGLDGSTQACIMTFKGLGTFAFMGPFLQQKTK